MDRRTLAFHFCQSVHNTEEAISVFRGTYQILLYYHFDVRNHRYRDRIPDLPQWHYQPETTKRTIPSQITANHNEVINFAANINLSKTPNEKMCVCRRKRNLVFKIS